MNDPPQDMTDLLNTIRHACDVLKVLNSFDDKRGSGAVLIDLAEKIRRHLDRDDNAESEDVENEVYSTVAEDPVLRAVWEAASYTELLESCERSLTRMTDIEANRRLTMEELTERDRAEGAKRAVTDALSTSLDFVKSCLTRAEKGSE